MIIADESSHKMKWVNKGQVLVEPMEQPKQGYQQQHEETKNTRKLRTTFEEQLWDEQTTS